MSCEAPALLLLLAQLCFGAPDTRQPASVILISVDTLRADHLSCYGYKRIRTPNIDSLAQGGTLFSAIDAQAPLTLPSHTSLFTSTYPFQNHIEENAERVPNGVTTLASILQAHGYKTAAFIGSVFLERQLGLDQGFEYYDSPFNFEAFSPMSGSVFLGAAGRTPYSGRDRRAGALVIASAKRWLAANQGQPTFVFVHLFDMHKPYRLPPSAARKPGESEYDAQLENVDGLIGAFKQELIRSGWWDRSLVVFLSDHGESLDEHGESSHGYFVYQSTLWVPLILHWPSSGGAHQERVDRPAGLIDVAPTIVDYLGIPTPASFSGRSLLKEDGAPRPVYSESLYVHDSFGWSPLRSIRLGSYQYIHAPRPELYDLNADPREHRNLFNANSVKAMELRRQLAKILAGSDPQKPPSPGSVSPQTRALLTSLGYLSGGPASGSAPNADPKDRLAEYSEYERAQVALVQRNLSQAIAILRDIARHDPRNLLALRDLAGCYLDRHMDEQARATFERVVAASPEDYPSQFQLGIADERLGRLQEARAHLQIACGLAPGATQCQKELRAVGR